MATDQILNCSKSNKTTKNSIHSSYMNEKKPSSVYKGIGHRENNQNPDKNLGIYDINTETRNDKKESEIATEYLEKSWNSVNELQPETKFYEVEAENDNIFSNQDTNISNSSQCLDSSYNSENTTALLKTENTVKKKSNELCHVAVLHSEHKSPPLMNRITRNIDQQVNPKAKTIDFVQEECSHFDNNRPLSILTEKIPERNSQSSLPDILSTLNLFETKVKTQNSGSSISDKGRSPKSLLIQTSYLPNLLSSEALHNEMEIELKQLKNLHSLQANQSIYRLAYDENVTDQSEADSKSPSPIDPESNVPSSLTSAEILIHEADSNSDAGSEDVELLPHRYESETFLNENKHVYVNKLSLAVELLRTQEKIPYDQEFKRVEGEKNITDNIVPSVHTSTKVNMLFDADSGSPNTLSLTNYAVNTKATAIKNGSGITSQSQLKQTFSCSSDNAILSDPGFDHLDNGLCEAAKEAALQGIDIQDNTGIQAERRGYRRFGAHQYLSPRTAVSLNPCFCCILM